MNRVVNNKKTKAKRTASRQKKDRDAGQMDLFAPANPEVAALRQMLDSVDIACMTPLDALNFLNDLKQKVTQAQ